LNEAAIKRATLKREWSDAMEVSARVMAGQSVVVPETYDPAWQAWHGGRRLESTRTSWAF
jgi:hypothetical protein